MSRKIIPIYATENDISQLVMEVKLQNNLQFASLEHIEQPEIEIMDDFINHKPFANYIATDKGEKISSRIIPQRNGGERYTVDMNNVTGVSIHAGGLYENLRLISGQIAPIGDSENSNNIFKLFRKLVRKKFEKIKSFYVGPEALNLFNQGTRLTPTTNSPEEYDLTLE